MLRTNEQYSATKTGQHGTIDDSPYHEIKGRTMSTGILYIPERYTYIVGIHCYMNYCDL